MLIAILIIVIVALLAAGLLIFALVWLVKSKNRAKKDAAAAARPEGTIGPSVTAVCSICGESRIIVKPELSACASCYSALGTKKPD
jgi:flagellar basal body-associated protein FliL